MDKEDKELYCYKQALSQPYWIQKLTETFSLDEAVRLSFFVYVLVVGGLFWGFAYLFLHFLPFGLRVVMSGFIGYYLGHWLSELEIDDRGVFFFMKDYLLFYLKYGMKADDCYINKGQVYHKPKGKLRKE